MFYGSSPMGYLWRTKKEPLWDRNQKKGFHLPSCFTANLLCISIFISRSYQCSQNTLESYILHTFLTLSCFSILSNRIWANRFDFSNEWKYAIERSSFSFLNRILPHVLLQLQPPPCRVSHVIPLGSPITWTTPHHDGHCLHHILTVRLLNCW